MLMCLPRCLCQNVCQYALERIAVHLDASQHDAADLAGVRREHDFNLRWLASADTGARVTESMVALLNR